MAWILITLEAIFLLILSLCAMGWFPSIAVLIFVWLFTYLPFSRKGMITCCGLNTTQTEHVLKTTSTSLWRTHSCYKAQKAGFLLNVIFFSHRAEIKWQKKGKESQAAEALSSSFSIILPCCGLGGKAWSGGIAVCWKHVNNCWNTISVHLLPMFKMAIVSVSVLHECMA